MVKQFLSFVHKLTLLGLAGFSILVSAQEDRTITGTVTDASDDMPLPGVSVVVQGTVTGAVTDFDGNYSIEVASQNNMLLFSYIGYGKKEIDIGNRSTIDIQLQKQASELDEVVVVGYGTVKKSDITGSVASVNQESLEAIPLVSVDQVLQGRMAGVQVTQGDFTPGKGASIRIRGGNSMLGGNDPLYVIDGFPGDFNNINPNDIQSIEVLKDASATAIYGARGANGVVLITTKRGQTGKSNIELNIYQGMQQQREKIEMLNAVEYATLANEKAVNVGIDPYYPDLNNLPGSTDWQDVVFDSAPVSSYNLSATGGNERNKYAISGSYFKQDGIVKNTDYERTSIRANLDNQINDWLRIVTSISGNHDVRNDSFEGFSWNSVVTSSLQTPPIAPIFDANGDYFLVSDLPSADPVWENPLTKIDGLLDREIGNNFIGNTQFNFKLHKNLELGVRLGAEYNSVRGDRYVRRIVPSNNNGGAGINQSDSYRLLNENTLNYTNTFNDKHDLNVLVGFMAQEDTFTRVNAGASDFVNDNLLTDDIGSGSVINGIGSFKSESTILSYLGRINYGYDNRYLFTFTARADGSSRLGNRNKWGFFPSDAVAWRVSQEQFLEDSKTISNLKFRASLGTTGSQEIGLYNSLSRLGSTVATLGADEARNIGFVPVALENPDLKWEVTEQLDVGMDLGLFDQRLEFTLDYYVKNTSDLLARVPLGISSGFENVLLNFGSIRNQGFEASVFARIIEKEKLKWNVGFNISTNRNEVLEVATDTGEFLASSLQSPIDAPVNIIREGEPLSSFFGFRTNGLWETNQDENSVQPNALAGDQRYVDISGDGTIDDDDKVIIGNPIPDFDYGFTSQLSWGNFDLNILVQGSQGGQVFNGLRFSVADNFARNANQFREALDRWTPQNQNVNAATPRLSNVSPLVSDRFVEDASFVRLREISLAYRLPIDKLKINWMTNLQVFINAQNWITITNFSGFDPEIRGSYGTLVNGVDYGTYPAAKTINIGANITF